jgi:hypothetical protein
MMEQYSPKNVDLKPAWESFVAAEFPEEGWANFVTENLARWDLNDELEPRTVIDVAPASGSP